VKCPYCGHSEDKVIDSRGVTEDSVIRRRRECLKCTRRFTTYERVEEIPLMVVKKDGRREPFDRKKILNGILTACEKRPISMEVVEEIVNNVENALRQKMEEEVSSEDIGGRIMKKLHDLDDIAYVRFASVYHQFKDVSEFTQEVRSLLKKD
jgi:transcriptional repressor NrdR